MEIHFFWNARSTQKRWHKQLFSTLCIHEERLQNLWDSKGTALLWVTKWGMRELEYQQGPNWRRCVPLYKVKLFQAIHHRVPCSVYQLCHIVQPLARGTTGDPSLNWSVQFFSWEVFRFYPRRERALTFSEVVFSLCVLTSCKTLNKSLVFPICWMGVIPPHLLLTSNCWGIRMDKA